MHIFHDGDCEGDEREEKWTTFSQIRGVKFQPLSWIGMIEMEEEKKTTNISPQNSTYFHFIQPKRALGLSFPRND